jgi:serine/threonine protein phosphatase PrpC
VQTLVDKGAIVAEEAYTHPERNKIYSCIGNVIPPKVTISASVTLLPGDRVLLATDGIWGCLSDESIGLCLSTAEVPVSLSMLIDMAEVCSAGQSDNMSGILFEWVGSKKSSRKPSATLDRLITDNDIDVSLMLIHAASGRPAN